MEENELCEILAFFRKVFWIRSEKSRPYDLTDLLTVGNIMIRENDIQRAVRALNSSKNGKKELNCCIDRLVAYAREMKKPYICKDSDEYRKLFGDFSNFYIELRDSVELNGKSQYCRMILSNIYDSHVTRAFKLDMAQKK
jgi:hypothetical protein